MAQKTRGTTAGSYLPETQQCSNGVETEDDTGPQVESSLRQSQSERSKLPAIRLNRPQQKKGVGNTLLQERTEAQVALKMREREGKRVKEGERGKEKASNCVCRLELSNCTMRRSKDVHMLR